MTVKFIILGLLFFSLAAVVPAQRSMTGRVVDVFDGRTLVIENAAQTRFAVRLQFVETPAPPHPLAPVAAAHLKKLALDKNATFEIKKIVGKINIGKVSINDVDLSRQILLDGAAWYAFSERAEQNPAERDDYLEMELSAKTGKRGVWATFDLKETWIAEAAAEPAARKIAAPQNAPENEKEAAARRLELRNRFLKTFGKMINYCGAAACLL